MSRATLLHTARAASGLALATYAAVVLAARPGSPLEDLFNVWAYNGLMVVATIVVAARVYAVPQERPAWAAFTTALASWTFGEIYYAAAQPEAFPSLADLGYLTFYPLVYVGMVGLLRSHARSMGGTLWLDGATASLAAAALAAAVLVELVLESTKGSFSTVATNLAYPLGDVLLLSAVFGVFALTAWRPGRRWLLLGLGVLSTALADAMYLFQTANGTYVEATWVDIFWPTSLLLVAWSAWADDRSRTRLAVDGRPLLAVPAICALIGIGILVYDHFDRLNVFAVALAAATLLAVLVRLATTFHDNSRLYTLARQEAITDSLTGLGNRRKLLTDLERRLAGEAVEPTLLMIFDLDGFKGYNDSFGHLAGDALLARLGAKIAEIAPADGAVYRLGGDEFCLVAPVADRDAEALIASACSALSERGEGFVVESSFGAVVVPDEAADASSALHLADERLYSEKHGRRRESDRMMDALLETLSLREPDLPVHLDSVGSLAIEIAEALDLRADQRTELVRAAQLHDLGKLAIPDEILHKAGPLDEREWAFVRQHPLVGERILRASSAFTHVATIVRSTHERWDGAGYPDGLAGDEIPLAARIVAVCDAFTAMTSARPYRSPLSESEALAELERHAGSQFDPTVVELLAAHLRRRLPSRLSA